MFHISVLENKRILGNLYLKYVLQIENCVCARPLSENQKSLSKNSLFFYFHSIFHSIFVRMRLFCEFNGCPCRRYCSNSSRCSRCGHGECWHVNSPQFESSRSPAVTPVYCIFRLQPVVPPLPEETPRFCIGVLLLPV